MFEKHSQLRSASHLVAPEIKGLPSYYYHAAPSMSNWQSNDLDPYNAQQEQPPTSSRFSFNPILNRFHQNYIFDDP